MHEDLKGKGSKLDQDARLGSKFLRNWRSETTKIAFRTELFRIDFNHFCVQRTVFKTPRTVPIVKFPPFFPEQSNNT